MTIGKTIRSAREAAGLDRKQCAKKLKISPSYLAQLEVDSPSRHVSERLETALTKMFKSKAPSITQVERHNKVVRAWYKTYLAKWRKSKAKKSTKKAS